MITCSLRYTIDLYKLAEFETSAKLWIPLVKRLGGMRHRYFLPHEGANNIASALFSLPRLAAYEDDECRAAFALAEENRCTVSYERSFMTPVFE